MTRERLPTKLLYVEDDEDLRELIAATFIDAGFEVTALASAESALELLATVHYDIIVTDYNLTGETGAWLLENAAARGYMERTVAILLTSERRPSGVAGYRVLCKPVDFGILFAAISDAVAHIAPVSPQGSASDARSSVELELVLYVTSSSQESQKAIRNLHRALRPYHESRFCLSIVDVAHGGDDAWYRLLEDDRIIVTPTLVRKRPGPKTWIVGSLAPIDAVERMLASALGKVG